MAILIPGQDPFWETLNGQILSVVGVIAANALTLYVLQGEKEKHAGLHPEKNYAYLDNLPRVSALLFLATSAYFLYVSYLESEYKKTSPFYWILFANLLVMGAISIKTGVTFTRRPEAAAEAVEEQ